jgi:trigger factor
MSEAKGFKIETVSPIKKKIIGDIPWEKVKSKFDETYRELSKTVTMKGFRRGKVPRSLIKRMFKKHVETDLLSELIRESSVEALKISENPIKVVDTPNEWNVIPGALEEGKPFTYEVEMEVIPEITIEDYKGIECKKLIVAVKEEDVDAKLETLKTTLTKEIPVEEGEITEGMVVSMNIMGKVEGAPFDFQNSRIAVPADDTFDHSNIPMNVAFNLKGKDIAKIGEDLEMDLKFDENSGDLSGKEGSFFIEFQGVNKKSVPEIDDELAKESGEADSLEELKTKFRKQLGEQNEEKSKQLLEKEILTEIIKKNTFEVGPSLVRQQAEMKVEQTLKGFGFPVDEKTMAEYKSTLVEPYKEIAKTEIMENLVIEAIATQEKIEVSEEELDTKLEEIAEESGESVERVKAEYNKENKIETVKYVLKLTKTLDFLKSESKVREEEVSEFPDPRKELEEKMKKSEETSQEEKEEK